MKVESMEHASVAYQGQGSSTKPTSGVSHNANVSEAARPVVQTTDRVRISTEDGNNDIAGKPVSNEVIKEAVDRINRNAQSSEAVFGIHEATNRVTIKIVDKETKEVIKEFPPEETLDMIAKVWEMAGILVDEKR